MNIRRATIEDLEAIFAIELENFSPEEAIDKTVLAKHIDVFLLAFWSLKKNARS